MMSLAPSDVSIDERSGSMSSSRQEGTDLRPLRRRTCAEAVGATMQHDTDSDTDENDENEESFQDAVAASSALVGENVLDSPRQRQHRKVVGGGHLVEQASVPPLPGIDGYEAKESYRERTSSESESRNPGAAYPSGRADRSNVSGVSSQGVSSSSGNAPASPIHTDDMSVGIMAQGLAWVERQRSRRRRLYLQNQAEQQLRKIQEAQQEETSTQLKRSLTDNPTFQTMAKTAKGTSNIAEQSDSFGRKSSESYEESHDEDEANGQFSYAVSQSGDGYSFNLPVINNKEEDDAAFIPPVRVEEEADLDNNPYILTPNEMQQIAVKVLPRGIAYCKWKRLYSLARDGDSFDQCLRCVQHAKNTLLVVRTSKNALMGAFADMPWDVHAHGSACYFGGHEACLFKVVGGKVKEFKWTGQNRYIQLCDIQHQMLAFGGGGDDGAFGLSVEKDFQVGSTGPCLTFNNEPLCDQENFEIVDLEIFGFLLGQF